MEDSKKLYLIPGITLNKNTMETLPADKLLQFNNNTLEEVRKCFGLHKPGAMKQAVEILKEWIKKQNHFSKKKFDNQYLETAIIVSKGSIEKAKERLDKACTLKTLMPHIFNIYDIRSLFKTDLKDTTQVFLPKMTKNNERIYVLRNVGQKFEPTIMISYTRVVAMMAEYIRLHDYASSFYVIVDYTKVNLTELILKVSIKEMQEISALLLEGCGFRIKEIFILSNSKVVDIFVGILKKVLSAKLSSRIHVYHDFQPLLDVFDKNILPIEYGGTEKSLDQIQEEWIDTLTSEENMKHLREIYSARTDESLRQKDQFNEQYLGMPGTFKTLSVD